MVVEMFLQCATLTEKHYEYHHFVYADRLAEPTTGRKFLQQQLEPDSAKMLLHCAKFDITR